MDVRVKVTSRGDRMFTSSSLGACRDDQMGIHFILSIWIA